MLEFDQVIAHCVPHGFTPRIVAEAVYGYNIIALVASGLGIAVVPQRATALHQRGTVYRRLHPAAAAVPMRIVVHDEPSGEPLRSLVELSLTLEPPALTEPETGDWPVRADLVAKRL